MKRWHFFHFLHYQSSSFVSVLRQYCWKREQVSRCDGDKIDLLASLMHQYMPINSWKNNIQQLHHQLSTFFDHHQHQSRWKNSIHVHDPFETKSFERNVTLRRADLIWITILKRHSNISTPQAPIEQMKQTLETLYRVFLKKVLHKRNEKMQEKIKMT